MSLLSDLFDPSRSKGPLRAITKPLYSWSLGGGIPDRLLVLPPDPWAGDAGKGRWIANRMLDDHGMQIALDPQVWSDASIAKDARRCRLVHGFEWLRDLRSCGDQARRHGRIVMQEWMDAQNRWSEGVWDFPVTATRLASWLTGYEFFCASGDDAFLESFYTSLIRQTRHLDRVDPAQLWGLDALCVIRGLIFTGLCLEGGEARLDHALGWLDHWLTSEIDGEGMHVSRSPYLAVQAAKQLIDIRGALVRGGLASPTALQAAIDRMMHAIRFFRMPDQKLACFHSTQEHDSNLLDALVRVSGVKIRKPPSQLEESGFESLARERVSVILDCGASASHPHDVCAHASPLAFEMSVGRDRLVVNCGTHPTDSTWADHLRATAAHSTLTCDDRNAYEIRHDGHIGRSASHVAARRDMIAGGIMVTLSHDGYFSLNGLIHTRRLTLSADGHALSGEDWLASDAPLIKPAPFMIRFHLHPRVQASLIQGGDAALLRLPSGGGWRFAKAGAALSLEPSIYCGSGIHPRKGQQLVLSGVSDGGNTRVTWSFLEEI